MIDRLAELPCHQLLCKLQWRQVVLLQDSRGYSSSSSKIRLKLWNDVIIEVNHEIVMFIGSSAISAVYSTIQLDSHECFTRSYDTILLAAVETGLVHALLAVLNQPARCVQPKLCTPTLRYHFLFEDKMEWLSCRKNSWFVNLFFFFLLVYCFFRMGPWHVSIPCKSPDFTRFFNEHFIVLFVFGTSYNYDLVNVYNFLQTTIYEIDVDFLIMLCCVIWPHDYTSHPICIPVLVLMHKQLYCVEAHLFQLC